MTVDANTKTRITVSGISAGGYMAVQTHVALSDVIGGAAVIAAGPYHCAEGNLGTAFSRCMSAVDIDVPGFVDFTREAAEDGRIAAVSGLHDASVWLFHSNADTIMSRGLADALAAYYRELVAPQKIKYVNDIDAAHGWPTLNTGADCLQMGGDFINACGFDAAGDLLTHLYGDLDPPAPDVAAPATIDLSPYAPTGSGLSAEGFVFAPAGCRKSPGDCRLHIAFHGCRQGSEFIANRFAAGTGLNNWAATNRIVILYPQVRMSLGNPQGCWDWWGYTGADYDLRSGKQIAAVAAIIAAWENRDI